MKPDKQDTTYQSFNPEKKIPPKIIFGTTAIKWIKAIVNVHSGEVGFYATVDHREDGSYFIRDVFYPKHSEMNNGTCEISSDGETDLMNWLINKGRDVDIEKIRFWGHSHHNMGTSPSNQDEKQSFDRMNSTQAFLIRAICNKSGEMSISFFDYHNQIRFDHIKWEIENDDDQTYCKEVIDKIQSIIDKTNEKNSSKLEDIYKIVSTDSEMNHITEKVVELKKLNEPVVKTHSIFYQNYPYSFDNHNDLKSKNINMFEDNHYERKKRHGAKVFKKKDVIDHNVIATSYPGNGLEEDREVIDKIMNSWENHRFLGE